MEWLDKFRIARSCVILFWFAVAAGAGTVGCSRGGGGSSGPPPPPPPPISVTVSPNAASLPLGATQQFTAKVTNSTNTAVSWNVNGIPGGNATFGTIAADGLYVAPPILPAQTQIDIEATSQADKTKTAMAKVTLNSDIAVSVAPATGNVELGATLLFAAQISSVGNPSRAVIWSISGPGCGTGCGTIDSNGLFTAPQILPSPPSAVVTATSVADPSKTGTATVNLTSSFTLVVSGPTSVNAGATAQYTAILTPAPDSNPNTAISWNVSGTGCSSSACGTISSAGLYTAPAIVPSPSVLAITAIPAADPGKAASINVTIVGVSPISVQLAPTAATLALGHRQTFSAQVNQTSNQNVVWAVNGVAGGNAAVGQICTVNSNPCQPVMQTSGGSVDYLAPQAVPSPNPVTLTVTSQADPSKGASAAITIIAHVVLSVAPSSVTLAPGATQQFTATVVGTTNQDVTWQISGAGCSGPGSPCGTISLLGFYVAPLAPPSPNTLTITATSQDDPTRSASASVTIATGPNILLLLPSSATAGAAGGFTLEVQGGGFVPSSPGPGSTILLNGAARTTNCTSATECATSLTGSDLTSAGNIAVQVQNPNAAASNQVAFIVVPSPTAEDIIPLTPTAPTATGKDIVVVDPTTAASSFSAFNLNLDIAAAGLFDVANNNCVLSGSAIVVARPAAGTASVDICAFSLGGLDASMAYSITGPSPNDVNILGVAPLGLGIIRLTLEISATTLPGPRTMFVENANKDKAAASGVLEVK